MMNNTNVGRCVVSNKFVSIKNMNYDQKTVFMKKNVIVSAECVAEYIAALPRAEQKHLLRKMSAFDFVMHLIKSTDWDAQKLADWQDREYTLQNASITYPLLRPVAAGNLIVSGKKRYAVKPVTILGQDFLVTNYIYMKNVDKLKTALNDDASYEADPLSRAIMCEQALAAQQALLAQQAAEQNDAEQTVEQNTDDVKDVKFAA